MPINTYQGLGAPQARLILLSSASTALTLTQDNMDAFNVWQVQSSASRIFLPNPSQGMATFIFFANDAVSTGTKVGATTGRGYDVVTTGGTTGAYGRFTTEEGGHGVWAVAVTDSRWALFPYGSVALSAVTSG